jgi:hypothetical protein
VTRYGDMAQPINGLRSPYDSIELHGTIYFPLRREGRNASAEPVCSCARFLCANCTRDRGCSEHPVFPAPSDFLEGQSGDANLGRSAPRDRGRVFSCHRPRRRAIQYPETPAIESTSRGVLDRPPSRAMTSRGCLKIESVSPPRHCEERKRRSNPSSPESRYGLLRCARKDGGARSPISKDRRNISKIVYCIRKTLPSTVNPALTNSTPPSPRAGGG